MGSTHDDQSDGWGFSEQRRQGLILKWNQVGGLGDDAPKSAKIWLLGRLQQSSLELVKLIF
jgi:hypothetical protein